MGYTIETKPIQNYIQCSITFCHDEEDQDVMMNAALLRSIVKSAHLCNPIISPKFKKLQFACHKIVSLHQHMAKMTLFHSLNLHKIIFDITHQVKHIVEEENKSFVGFHPNHVYVIDDNKFISPLFFSLFIIRHSINKSWLN